MLACKHVDSCFSTALIQFFSAFSLWRLSHQSLELVHYMDSDFSTSELFDQSLSESLCLIKQETWLCCLLKELAGKLSSSDLHSSVCVLSPARAFLKLPLPCTFSPSLCAQENTKDRHFLLMWGRCDVRVGKPEVVLLLCVQSCAAITGEMEFLQGCSHAQGRPSMPMPWLQQRGRKGTCGDRDSTGTGGGAAVEQCCRVGVICGLVAHTHITRVLVLFNRTLEGWKQCQTMLYKVLVWGTAGLASRVANLSCLLLSCCITGSIINGCHITGESLIHHKWQPCVSAGIFWV